MTTFNQKDLFSSGPHRFTVRGTAQRHHRHDRPGADGSRITVAGRTGRTIEQRGTLAADSVAQLTGRIDAIESAMTGEPADLVDDLGRTWPHTLMLEFHPGPVRRLAGRLTLDYRIVYSQTGF